MTNLNGKSYAHNSNIDINCLVSVTPVSTVLLSEQLPVGHEQNECQIARAPQRTFVSQCSYRHCATAEMPQEDRDEYQLETPSAHQLFGGGQGSFSA